MSADLGATKVASRIGSRLLESLQHRLELFGVELTEEKERLLITLVSAIVAATSIFVGFLSLNALLAFLFWEQRVPLFVALTVLYLGGGIALALVTKAKIMTGPAPFAATMEELQRDAEAFRSEASHD